MSNLKPCPRCGQTPDSSNFRSAAALTEDGTRIARFEHIPCGYTLTMNIAASDKQSTAADYWNRGVSSVKEGAVSDTPDADYSDAELADIAKIIPPEHPNPGEDAYVQDALYSQLVPGVGAAQPVVNGAKLGQAGPSNEVILGLISSIRHGLDTLEQWVNSKG